LKIKHNIGNLNSVVRRVGYGFSKTTIFLKFDSFIQAKNLKTLMLKSINRWFLNL